MKKIIYLFLMLLMSQYSFAQNRAFDVYKTMFLKKNAFSKETLTEYYSNLMGYNMAFPKGKGSKIGFLYANGKVFKDAEFDYASDFINGKSNVAQDSVCGLLFSDGTVKYYPEFNITYFTTGDVGLAIKNNKYGFINLKGEVLISFTYDDAFPFYEGIASVKYNNRWFYINEQGVKVLSDSLITGYQPTHSSKAIVYDSTKVSKSNKLGTILPTMVEYMNKVQKPGYKQGLYDFNKKILLTKMDFDEISGYSEEGLMKVVKDGKVGLLNENNKLIIPIEYDEIGNFADGLILAKKGKWGIINKKNKVIIPFQYNKIGSLRNGLAFTENNNKVGYIDKKNNCIIKADFDFCWHGDFIDEMALVKKNNKYGYINKLGKTVLPTIYDDALPFVNSKALVYDDLKKKYFFINKQGKNVFGKEYSDLWQEKEGFIKFVN